MNISMTDLTLTSIDTITAYDVVTGDFKFSLDELQNATISQSQEKTDITGKQGRKLGSLKKNKAVKISGTNGLVSAGLMELQSGCSFDVDTDTYVMWTDHLNVSDNATTTSYEAIAMNGDGTEIEQAYVKNEDGTLGTALVQGAATADGVFTYDPTTKVMNFEAGEITNRLDGEANLVVFYKRKIKGHVLENLSDKYSEKCTLYIDATGEDTCGRVFRVQFYVPKADFDGNFELAMGDSQTVHNFEAEALAGSCGTSGSYWTFTIFGEETA